MLDIQRKYLAFKFSDITWKYQERLGFYETYKILFFLSAKIFCYNLNFFRDARDYNTSSIKGAFTRQK